MNNIRVLLDTNIVIHRENKIVSNYSIGHLFRWIDRLKYTKVIHQYTISEIQKYRDPETQEAISVKLEAYEVLRTINQPDGDFLNKIEQPEKNENDHIDNCLLYELYLGHVDMFITEDRKLRNKALNLGLMDRVFSINSFITKATEENPDLIEYKALAVKKTYFGDIDINNTFFDTFRNVYQGFDQWFSRKCDEEAYICRSDNETILGFLYLKTENIDENYGDIVPPFLPKRRLKVGTFKVESTGFRLGERFVKIIFDNALKRKVDEIYVTLFTDRKELLALKELLSRWGFSYHGQKYTTGEEVLVKPLHKMIQGKTPKFNYPNFLYSVNKFIMPIYPKYHTTLLPDSKLNTENQIDFLGPEPHRYALQKVYVSWASTNGAKPGDLILFYRMGEEWEIKKYKSVVTTLAIVDEIITNIHNEEELLSQCQNRSVFTTDELKSFWRKDNVNIKILKFIFVKSLNKRLNLDYLQDHNIIEKGKGPRPFTAITDTQFDMIMHDSLTDTEISYVDKNK